MKNCKFKSVLTLGLLSLSLQGCFGQTSEDRPYPVSTQESSASRPRKSEAELLSEKLGLHNFNASTCYANSVTKLLSIHPRILELTGSKRHADRIQKEVRKSFGDLFRSFRYPKQSGDGYKSELSEIAYWMQVFSQHSSLSQFNLRGEQQDAAQYLDRVLVALGYEQHFDSFKPASLLSFQNGAKRLAGIPDHGSSSLDLNLQNANSVSEALDQMFASETLDFPISRSGERNDDVEENVTKRTILLRGDAAPEQVFVRLNRFENEGEAPRKIVKPIVVSKQIRIEFYPSNEYPLVPSETTRLTSQTIAYKPIGVVVHVGSLAFGHYYAYLYDSVKKSWFIHNDEEVARMDENKAFKDMDENAYIILYSKMTP